MKYVVDLTYRDADNYKDHFSVTVDEKDYPDILIVKYKLKERGEYQLVMGDWGTPNQDSFFGSDIHPYSYEDHIDHNLFEVNRIRSVVEQVVDTLQGK